MSARYSAFKVNVVDFIFTTPFRCCFRQVTFLSFCSLPSACPSAYLPGLTSRFPQSASSCADARRLSVACAFRDDLFGMPSRERRLPATVAAACSSCPPARFARGSPVVLPIPSPAKSGVMCPSTSAFAAFRRSMPGSSACHRPQWFPALLPARSCATIPSPSPSSALR